MASKAEEAVRRTIEQANRLIGSSSPALVLRIMQDAEKMLAPTLKKYGGKTHGNERWTETATEVTMAQVRLTTDYAKKRLLGLTHAQARKAVSASYRSTVGLIHTLEKAHKGVTRPLELDKAGRMTAAINGTSSSLLMRHQRSVNRYGKAMVEEFEKTLRTGLLTGMTNDQMINRLISQAKKKGITASTLHKGEPGYFPDPTGFVRKRYWAERIVRTEKAYAYNQSAMESIEKFRQEDPKARKKIVALIGDPRTASDSIAVHGQIREVNQPFTDGAGRSYLFPPGRPNDRESVIPWHADWKELASTAAPPVGEVDEATKEAMEQQEGAKISKAELMALVAAKKAEILAKPPAPPKPPKPPARAKAASKKTEASPVRIKRAPSKAAEQEAARAKAREMRAAAKIKKSELEQAKLTRVSGSRVTETEMIVPLGRSGLRISDIEREKRK